MATRYLLPFPVSEFSDPMFDHGRWSCVPAKYPSVHQVRQQAVGDWSNVISDVQGELRVRAGQPPIDSLRPTGPIPTCRSAFAQMRADVDDLLAKELSPARPGPVPVTLTAPAS